MPCPFFEPRRRIATASEIVLRFPLIFEFEGLCHAAPATPAPASTYHCNHGNPKAGCPVFPAASPVSAIRFHVARQTPQSLTIVVIEEQNHWPRSSTSIDFEIAAERLVPDIDDLSRRAQTIHFCRSYLEKHVCQ